MVEKYLFYLIYGFVFPNFSKDNIDFQELLNNKNLTKEEIRNFSSIEILNRFCDLLNKIEALPPYNYYEYLDADYGDQQKIQVIVMEDENEIMDSNDDNDDNAISNLHYSRLLSVENENNMYHPSQIFDCSLSYANEQNLIRFLHCASHFNATSYFIIHAENMNFEVRETLLLWLNNAIEENTLILLTIIFSSTVGSERFLFLDLAPTIYEKEERLQQVFEKFEYIKENQCFLSPSGSGKSYEISNLLKNYRNSVRIDINENFTPIIAIEILKNVQNALQMSLGIHFNVSAYAPLHEVSSFFDNLIFHGIIWDKNNGEMLSIQYFNINLFIEIHTSPKLDKNYKNNNSIKKILNQIPSIKLFSNKIENLSNNINNQISKENKCLTSSQIRCIAIYFFAFEQNYLNKTLIKSEEIFSSIKTIDLTIDESYKLIYKLKSFLQLNNYYLTEDLKHFNFFIKLFYERLQWFQNLLKSFSVTSKSSTEISIINADCLFIHLLIESVKLSEFGGKFLFINDENNILSSYISVIRDELNYNNFTFVCFNNHENSFQNSNLLISNYLPKQCCIYNDQLNIDNLIHFISIKFSLSIEIIKKVINKHHFILTPKITQIILFLFDRMKICENVMFTGATGVGKTETLTFFSSLLQECSVNYNGMTILSSFISKNKKILSKEKIANELKLLYCDENEVNEKSFEFLNKLFQICMDPIFQIDSSTQVYQILQNTKLKKTLINDPNKLQQFYNDKFPNFNKLHPIIDEIYDHLKLNLFHCIHMDSSYTFSKFNEEMNIIIEKAETLFKIDPNDKLIIFIDELNTTLSIMGILENIYSSGYYNGKKLQNNIFWVSAINPFIINNQNENDKYNNLNFTGSTDNHPDNNLNLEYCVRPIPNSFDCISIEFPSMTLFEEKYFIESLIQSKDKNNKNKLQSKSITNLILISQSFIQKLQMKRIAISIRDILRTIKIYIFLKNNPFLLFKSLKNLSENKLHWKSLIISLCMCYYLRLTPELRLNYIKLITNKIQEIKDDDSSCPIEYLNLKSKSKFYNTFKTTMIHLYENSNIPNGIARTNALLENLWCIVVSCCSLVPIIIIGPPGCSKTLSFSIALENLKPSKNQQDLYKKLYNLEVFRYQCTEQSTDNEISGRFESAIIRQQQFDEDLLLNNDNNPNNPNNNHQQVLSRCVVFLDEAGLSEEIPLKAIHYYLDHPIVACVIMSNISLDAAKMNRVLQLIQFPTSNEDLYNLTAGSLFNITKNKIKELKAEADIVQKICEAYEETLKITQIHGLKGSFFQLRDFILFLRYLRNQKSKKSSKNHDDLDEINKNSSESSFQLQRDRLLKALERNFNGVERNLFREIVTLWFNKLNQVFKKHNFPLFSIPTSEEYSSTLSLLQENLEYRIKPYEDPNIAPYRYLLLIDPTNSGNAISMLYSCKLCKPVKEIDLKTSIIYNHTIIPDRIDITERFHRVKSVKAIRGFHSVQSRVLSFNYDDIIYIRNQFIDLQNGKWWEGVLHGEIGIFPVSYVKIYEIYGELPTITELNEFHNENIDKMDIDDDNDDNNDYYYDDDDDDDDLIIPSVVEIINQSRKNYQPNQTIQISISDFRKDKTEECKTKAVQKIVHAMKDGKTVILINSESIDGCFYDVYNRYFKLIEKQEERTKTGSFIESSEGKDSFINVAIGKHSRECYVHPDFKIILYLPESSLPKTSLPFLSRFEKYRISMKDFVYDQIQFQRFPSWESYIIDDHHQTSIIQLIIDGCIDFYNQFIDENDKNQQNLSSFNGPSSLFFFGVNYESIYSIILESMNQTDVNSKIPFIRYPFILQSLENQNKQDQEQNKLEKTIDGNLLLIIRKINYRLLQLVRPEFLYFESKLKKNQQYIQQYIMEQEHFSIYRLMRNILQAQKDFQNSLLDSFPHKWCVFTRSCGEFQKYKLKLMKFISIDLFKNNDHLLFYLTLDEIKSTNQLENKIESILLSSCKFLLITVDMDECTDIQLNAVRQLIDTYISDDQIVFIILHFPPVKMISCSSYPAIFSNSWEFTYIDSLGISIKEENEKEEIIEDPDGRTWIASAFDLSIDIKFDQINYFVPKFYEILNNILVTSTISFALNIPQDIVNQVKVYSKTPSVRSTQTVELLQKQCYLVERFLSIFKLTWTNSFLKEIVNTACNDIISANVTKSLIDRVIDGLHILLKEQVKQFLSFFYQEFQFYHLYQLIYPSENIKNEKIQAYTKLYNLSLHLITFMNPNDLFSNNNWKYTSKSLILNCNTNFISRVPLFFSIHKFMKNALEKIILNHPFISHEIRCKQYFNYLSNHTALLSILNMLKSPLFLNDFIEDILDFEFNFTNINNIQPIRLLLSFILKSFSESFTSKYNSNNDDFTDSGLIISIYYCIKHLFYLLEYIYSYFSTILLTISSSFNDDDDKMKILIDEYIKFDSPRFQEFIRFPEFNWNQFILGKTKIDSTDPSINSNLKLITIDILWNLFSSLFTENDKLEKDVNKLKAWTKAFRIFHFRCENIINNYPNKNNKEFHHYYSIMLTSFIIIRNSSITMEEFLGIIRIDEIKTFLLHGYQLVLENRIESNLHYCLTILQKFLNINSDQSKEQLNSIFSNLIFSNLRGFDNNKDMNIILNSLKTILNLFHNEINNTMYLLENNFSTLWNSSLSFEFHIELFNNYISKEKNSFNSKDYKKDIFNHCVSLISSVHHFDPEKYSFYYHLLVSNELLNNNNTTPYFKNIEQFIFQLELQSILNNENLSTFSRKRTKYLEKRENKVKYSSVLYEISQCSLVTAMIQNVNSVAILDQLSGIDLEFLRSVLTENPKNYNKISAHSPQFVQEYFLQQFVMKDLLKILINDEYRKTKLDLNPKWFQPLSDMADNYILFPFMVETDTFYGKEYYTLKELIKNENQNELNAYINQKLNNNQLFMYPLRMFLITIGYYEYFHKNVKANFLYNFIDSLKDKLKINQNEMVAYKFIFSGPQRNQQPEMYSSNVRELNVKYDFVDGHYLFNLLATALGSKPDQCHFYPIIFNLAQLNAHKMIGSAYNHEFYDCGYRLEGNRLDNNAGIMNDNKRFRALTNSMVWAPIVWNSILFPNQYVTNCKTVYHLMNYVQDENRGGRSEYKQYQEYANSRGFTFLRLFEQDPDAIQRKMDWKLTVSISLFDYLQEQWNNNTNYALKSYLKNKEDVKAYENYLLNLFTQSDEKYQQIKKIYQTSIEPNTPLANIDLIQQKQVEFISSPFTITQLFSNYVTSLKGNQSSNLLVFNQLRKLEDQINLIKEIPFLVSCYIIFNEILYGKIKQKDFYTPFQDVLNSLTDENQISMEQKQTILQLFEQFMKKYNNLSENIQNVQFECGDAVLPKIEMDQSFPATILSTDETNDVDSIYKAMKHLLENVQGEILSILKNNHSISSDDSDSDSDDDFHMMKIEKQNPKFELENHGFYFDLFTIESNGNIPALSYQFENNLSIISTGNENISTWLENLIKFHRISNKRIGNSNFVYRDSIEFNLIEIERQCIQLLSGIPSYLAESIRKPLLSREKLISDKQMQLTKPLEDSISKIINQANINEDYNIQSLLTKLNECSIEFINKYSVKIPSNAFIALNKFYQQEEQKILSVIEILTEILQNIITDESSNEKQIDPDQNIIKYIDSITITKKTAFKQFKSRIKKLSLKNIISLIQFILKVYQLHLWKFSKKIQALHIDLNEEQENNLSKSFKYFISLNEKSNHDYLQAIRYFLDCLMNEKSEIFKCIEQNSSKNISSSMILILKNDKKFNSSFLKEFSEKLFSNKLDHANNFLSLVLPESIKIGNFAFYQNWLHSLSGKLILSQTKRKQELSNKQKSYIEKIPKKINKSKTDELLKEQQQNSNENTEYQSLDEDEKLWMHTNIYENENENENDEQHHSDVIMNDIPSSSASGPSFDYRSLKNPIINHSSSLQSYSKAGEIRGILNERQNGWLSSVLQCLASNSIFVSTLDTICSKFLKPENENEFIKKLYRIIQEINYSDEIENSDVNIVSIRNLLSIKIRSNSISLEEFARDNPRKLYSQLPNLLSENLQAIPKRLLKLVFSQIVEIKCENCSSIIATEEHSLLNIPISSTKCNFYSILNNYFGSGKKDPNIQCKTCDGDFSFERKLKLQNKEKFLLSIALKNDDGHGIHIKLPRDSCDFDIFDFCVPHSDKSPLDDKIINASLFSTVHSVTNNFMTHFTSTVRDATNPNEWFDIDDSQIIKLNSQTIKDNNACLLFFFVHVKEKLHDQSSLFESTGSFYGSMGSISSPISTPNRTDSNHSSPYSSFGDSNSNFNNNNNTGNINLQANPNFNNNNTTIIGFGNNNSNFNNNTNTNVQVNSNFNNNYSMVNSNINSNNISTINNNNTGNTNSQANSNFNNNNTTITGFGNNNSNFNNNTNTNVQVNSNFNNNTGNSNFQAYSNFNNNYTNTGFGNNNSMANSNNNTSNTNFQTNSNFNSNINTGFGNNNSMANSNFSNNNFTPSSNFSFTQNPVQLNQQSFGNNNNNFGSSSFGQQSQSFAYSGFKPTTFGGMQSNSNPTFGGNSNQNNAQEEKQCEECFMFYSDDFCPNCG